MALHFVKTAVLSSSDGVDFGTEVAVESEDTRKARADAEAATRKPLFQQLADLRDKKQEEFDENKKKIFGRQKNSRTPLIGNFLTGSLYDYDDVRI